MASASPSAVLHDNSRHSLSLQVAQNNSVHPSFDTATDTITLVLNVGRSRSRLHFKFHKVVWQGENFNTFLFRNSLLNIIMKKLQKSINICQSYRKNKSVSFFMDRLFSDFSNFSFQQTINMDVYTISYPQDDNI